MTWELPDPLVLADEDDDHSQLFIPGELLVTRSQPRKLHPQYVAWIREHHRDARVEELIEELQAILSESA